MGSEHLALYHFEGCPYCLRVRSVIDELGLDVELRNVHMDPRHGADLTRATGRGMVPCLRVEAAHGCGWMHEAADIIECLRAQHQPGRSLA